MAQRIANRDGGPVLGTTASLAADSGLVWPGVIYDEGTPCTHRRIAPTPVACPRVVRLRSYPSIADTPGDAHRPTRTASSMSENQEDSDTEGDGEQKSYGLLGRVILFLFIAGPASMIAFGLWVRIGVNASTVGGNGKGSSSMTLVFVLWIVGLLATAIPIFKK